MTIWMRHERQLYGNFLLLLSHGWRQNWVKLQQLVSLNVSLFFSTSTCTSACEHLHEHSSMFNSDKQVVQLLELHSFFVSHTIEPQITSNCYWKALLKAWRVMRWNANWEKWKSRHRNRNWRFSVPWSSYQSIIFQLISLFLCHWLMPTSDLWKHFNNWFLHRIHMQ